MTLTKQKQLELTQALDLLQIDLKTLKDDLDLKEIEKKAKRRQS